MANFSYVITADNSTDIPYAEFMAEGVDTAQLCCILEGKAYDGVHEVLDNHTFWSKMRSKSLPTTQQVNVEASKELFERYLSQGLDVLHFAFASTLSGTYQSAMIAKEDLEKKYPDRKLIVINTLGATLAQALLIRTALKKREEGMSIDDLAAWSEAHKLNADHDIMPDDLFHLFRGGRLSKTSAIAGSLLGIKPILTIDDNGKLFARTKCRGKKKAMAELVSRLASSIRRDLSETVYIAHADNEADAKELAAMITEKTGLTDIRIYFFGPVIGAHVGPDTLAVFYFSNGRVNQNA